MGCFPWPFWNSTSDFYFYEILIANQNPLSLFNLKQVKSSFTNYQPRGLVHAFRPYRTSFNLANRFKAGFFFGHSLKNSRWKKLKLKLKKLKTPEFFTQNSKFRQIFQKFKKVFNQIWQFLSKIRQNLSKTQEFTQNSRYKPQKPQISGKSTILQCRKNVQKKSLV